MSLRKNSLSTIEYKTIDKEHIQNLAQFIYSEYQKRLATTSAPFFRSHVKCFEKVSYEDDGIEVFNDGSGIYKERIKSIVIETRLDEALYIKLRLNHGQVKTDDIYFSDSDIEIGGAEIDQVHDIITRMNEEIRSIPEQENLLIKNYNFFSSASFTISIVSFGYLVDLSNESKKHYTPFWRDALTDWGSLIGSLFVATLFGGLIGYLVYDKFAEKSREIWPMIDLKLGPDHLRPEVKKRRFLSAFAVLFVIPLGVAILYDLFKIVVYNFK